MEKKSSQYDFSDKLPMKKTFNCSHGWFELPSEIMAVGITSRGVKFYCADGKYFAYYNQNNDGMFLTKIEDR